MLKREIVIVLILAFLCCSCGKANIETDDHITMDGENGKSEIDDAKPETEADIAGKTPDNSKSENNFEKVSEIEKEEPIPIELNIVTEKDKISHEIEAIRKTEVGQLVYFGVYEQDADETTIEEPLLWTLLEKSNGKALLFCEFCIIAQPFNASGEGTSWENCSLRQWLNNVFVYEAFVGEERERLVESWNMSENSYNVTKDKVFLLDKGQLNMYSTVTSSLNVACATQYAELTNASVFHYEEGEKYSGIRDGACVYWLRDKGTFSAQAMTIGWDGAINEFGEDIGSYKIGVRPAIWVNIEPEPVELDEAIEGDVVEFGHYEQDLNSQNGVEPIQWIVLERTEEDILLMSRYCLDLHKFNSGPLYGGSSDWEKSEIRYWLNQDFYSEAFSLEEKEKISVTYLKNPPNPFYGTDNGNDTYDKVFLLSYNEAVQYLDVWNKRIKLYTNRVIEKYEKDSYRRYPYIKISDSTMLRTKGDGNWDIMYISSDGEIIPWGDESHKVFGISPVIRVKVVSKEVLRENKAINLMDKQEDLEKYLNQYVEMPFDTVLNAGYGDRSQWGDWIHREWVVYDSENDWRYIIRVPQSFIPYLEEKSFQGTIGRFLIKGILRSEPKNERWYNTKYVLEYVEEWNLKEEVDDESTAWIKIGYLPIDINFTLFLEHSMYLDNFEELGIYLEAFGNEMLENYGCIAIGEIEKYDSENSIDFSKKQMQIFEEFLERGGNLFLYCKNGQILSTPNFSSFLKKIGIVYLPGSVLDDDSREITQDELSLLCYTEGSLGRGKRNILCYSVGYLEFDEKNSDYTIKSALVSSPAAYIRQDILETADEMDGEAGKYTIGLFLENESNGSKVVLLSGDIPYNAGLEFGNEELLLEWAQKVLY